MYGQLRVGYQGPVQGEAKSDHQPKAANNARPAENLDCVLDRIVTPSFCTGRAAFCARIRILPSFPASPARAPRPLRLLDTPSLSLRFGPGGVPLGQ